MSQFMQLLVWIEKRRHWAVKWGAIIGVAAGVLSISLGAQPRMVWLGVIAAYVVQLHLLWDIAILKREHVEDLRQARVDGLYK